MSSFYIKKDRKIELDKIILLWFNFLGWCNSLLDKDDVKYIHSKGINGFHFFIFVTFFYPLYYIKNHGFNGVPFPFNFLKKKRKEMKSIFKKANDQKSRVKKTKNKIKRLKFEKKKILRNMPIVSNVNEQSDVSVKIIDSNISLLNEKLNKNNMELKKLNGKAVAKKKKKSSNNSYLMRRKRRDAKILKGDEKLSLLNNSMNLFFHFLMMKKINHPFEIDFKKYTIYNDFIAINVYNLANIREKDIIEWLTKHNANKEFIYFVYHYLESKGFIFRKKYIAEALDILYPHLKAY